MYCMPPPRRVGSMGYCGTPTTLTPVGSAGLWQAVPCRAGCHVMRCDAVRCGAMRCDAMRCHAVRCDGRGLCLPDFAIKVLDVLKERLHGLLRQNFLQPRLHPRLDNWIRRRVRVTAQTRRMRMPAAGGRSLHRRDGRRRTRRIRSARVREVRISRSDVVSSAGSCRPD